MSGEGKAIRTLLVLVLTAIVAAVVGACGSSSSSGDPSGLLKQTFGGSHTVNSGNLSVSLSIGSADSATAPPLAISFGGPFQSNGKGKLPASNFTIGFKAQGRSGSLGILSTGTAGYLTLAGTSYQLPAATFQKLESSFAQVASSPTSGSGSGTLSKLGIDPLQWLVSPKVIGSESVGGTDTTHIRAGVNVSSFLADLNTFLSKASSLGVTGATKIPTSISPATRAKIAGEVQNPTFDVWTGTSDKTVRRLSIKVTLPVSGQFSTLLGGVKSALISLSMTYANLNQPQTIQAPTNIRPFSEFTTKMQSLLSAVQSASGTGGSSAGGSGSTASGSAGSASSGSAANLQSYSQCLQAAGTDLGKAQKCASLLNSGG